MVSWKKVKRNLSFAAGTAKVLGRDPGAFTTKALPFEWNIAEENRIALINKVLTLYPDPRYLEIGCFRDACFSKIVAPLKVGVDPMSGGTLRMTSDAYFEEFKDRFDVIFVDGLHTYEQSRKDALNALERVPVGGAVLFHDMIPLNWRSARPERIAYRWNGDVWKTAVELAMGKGFDFTIIKADHGIGFAVKTSDEIEYPDLYPALKSANFRDYIGMLKIIRLTGFDEAIRMLTDGNLRGIAAERPRLRLGE